MESVGIGQPKSQSVGSIDVVSSVSVEQSLLSNASFVKDYVDYVQFENDSFHLRNIYIKVYNRPPAMTKTCRQWNQILNLILCETLLHFSNEETEVVLLQSDRVDKIMLQNHSVEGHSWI